MKLSFLGGARTVTGSKTLFEYGERKILIDCGLFQGLKELRLKNWESIGIDVGKLDAVILTHAHLDHSGFLPALYRSGYRGKIYASAPTRELARLILLDSAHLLVDDADFANRQGYSKHRPALPLYDRGDVEAVMRNFEGVRCGKWIDFGEDFAFRLQPSGHILGSTFVELEAGGKRLVFSGDLGRSEPLLYPPPARIESADVLVIESTYGDRHHVARPADVERRLGELIRETYALGGQILIPSFSVGRVQELLHLLARLESKGELPDLPVYLDSPMGLAATQVFTRFPEWHRLDRAEVDRIGRLTIALESRDESIRIMRERRPAVIIAGSGMLTGGRALHHLAARAGDPHSTVILVGFQATGTRGRLLKEGATEIKLHGRYFPVRCRVESLDGLSGHADCAEMIDWLKRFRIAPTEVFLNHGEPQSLDSLRRKLRDELEWRSQIPSLGESFDLGDT